jgi:hypothetical protein
MSDLSLDQSPKAAGVDTRDFVRAAGKRRRPLLHRSHRQELQQQRQHFAHSFLKRHVRLLSPNESSDLIETEWAAALRAWGHNLSAIGHRAYCTPYTYPKPEP